MKRNLDERLEVTGAIGMGGAVQGVIHYQLEENSSSTVLKFSHRAIGEVNAEIQQGYSSGWQDLLGVRLKAYVEEGVKYGIGHESASAIS